MYYIESLDVLLSTDVNQKEVSVCRNEKTFDKKFKFPKSARLRKTDEFLSVFNFRPLRYSAHFVIYKKQTNLRARLGLVINKRYAPYAVTRNFIKRRAREAFRLRQSEFNGWDLLLKLNRKFDEKIIQSASSTALAIASIDEIYELLDYAA